MSDENYCIYTKKSKDNFVILSLYVDDTLIVSSDKEYVMKIKECL